MPGPWGKAIERLRNEKGLTRKVVAKRARMTPTTYGRIEHGQHTQTRKLQNIADVFGVPIEDVLQILLFPMHKDFGRTVPETGQGHAQGAHVSAETEIRDLRLHVTHLEEQIAEITAEREARQRKRRQRLSGARTRKPVRPAPARKAR